MIYILKLLVSVWTVEDLIVPEGMLLLYDIITKIIISTVNIELSYSTYLQNIFRPGCLYNV